MRVLRWIIPLMVTALILSSAGLVSAQGTNTISGTVTDAQTGAPVQGALVQVEGTDPLLSDETDADGAYQIAGVPVEQYSVSASADGYESETETGVEVSDGDATTLDFALQPMAPEEESDAGKQPGDRKGYVGTFSLGDGVFTVTTKKEEVVIRIPEEGLEPITRTPGRAADGANGSGRVAGTLIDGAAVAVLVEFVENGDGAELVPEARQIVVKPKPQAPVVGAVVSVDTNEEGIRILTIMRPDGTTKEVQLGRGVDSPENGELVTVFPTRGRGAQASQEGDKGGPPTAKGLVRAEQVRQRLEGFLRGLTAEDGDLSPQAAERLAQRVDRMAEILEKHADKHVNILQKLSKKNLPAKAAEGMRKALENAQRGRSQAKANVAAARAKAGPPAERGRGSGQVQPGGQPPEKGMGSGQVQPGGEPPEKGKGQAGGRDSGKGRAGK